jgi:hypothetical protein
MTGPSLLDRFINWILCYPCWFGNHIILHDWNICHRCGRELAENSEADSEDAGNES